MAKGQCKQRCNSELPEYYVALGFSSFNQISESVETLKRCIGKKAIIYSEHNWLLPLFKISTVKEFRKQIAGLSLREREIYIQNIDMIFANQEEPFTFSVEDQDKPIKGHPEGDLYFELANDCESGHCKIDYAVNRSVNSIMDLFGVRIDADHRGYLVGQKSSARNDNVYNEITIGYINDGFLPWGSVEHKTFVEDPCELVAEAGYDPKSVLPEVVSLGAMRIVTIDRKNRSRYR